LPGISSVSGTFTQNLAQAIQKLEQDFTPKASCQPSLKDEVSPPVSCIPCIPSAQGSSSMSALGSLLSIGGITIVPKKFFNMPPVSASWVDQVEKEEANYFPSVSILDFHSSLYDADVNCVTHPEWYCLS
jgi:hypothetical protein